jgi:DNA-3-methyladenine glycosylase I
MSDVVKGPDGLLRCAWVGTSDVALAGYHDHVWGTRTDDPTALFEALTLGVFEVGLSWKIVFAKRDGFRTAFRGFDVAAVAEMDAGDVDRLLSEPAIIRNRAKIEATLHNARAMQSASPRLDELAAAHVVTRKHAPRAADIPTSTPGSEAFAKQLKAQAYRFIGPTSVYAFMQNVGIVNDHVRGCFRAVDAKSGAADF